MKNQLTEKNEKNIKELKYSANGLMIKVQNRKDY